MIAVDQLLNTLLGGWPDETLSSRCYRWARGGVRAWHRRVPLADNASVQITKGYFGKGVELVGTSATVNVSLDDASVFFFKPSRATTFTFTTPSGLANTVGVFTLVIAAGGAYTITWPTNVTWSNGAPPDLSAAGVDVITFIWNGASFSTDYGAAFYGSHAVQGGNL